MNNYDKAIDQLDLSPYRQEWCCVCGVPKQEKHHVVYRSHGGKAKHRIHLCHKCHRQVHAHLVTFLAGDGLEMVVTEFPVPLWIAARMQLLGDCVDMETLNKTFSAVWHMY